MYTSATAENLHCCFVKLRIPLFSPLIYVVHQCFTMQARSPASHYPLFPSVAAATSSSRVSCCPCGVELCSPVPVAAAAVVPLFPLLCFVHLSLVQALLQQRKLPVVLTLSTRRIRELGRFSAPENTPRRRRANGVDATLWQIPHILLITRYLLFRSRREQTGGRTRPRRHRGRRCPDMCKQVQEAICPLPSS